MISTEQNTMQDQENSMHVTEIREYAIIFLYNKFDMPIVNNAT